MSKANKKGAPRSEVLSHSLYGQLRRIAKSYFRNERSGHTLAPTALVHEAYLRWANEGSSKKAEKIPLVSVFARLMRQILINQAVAKRRLKRGAGDIRVTLDEEKISADKGVEFDLIFLDEALNRLARTDPRLARLVEVRFFLGLTIAEAAKELNLSPATAKRDWAYAKAWLYHEIEEKRKAA